MVCYELMFEEDEIKYFWGLLDKAIFYVLKMIRSVS